MAPIGPRRASQFTITVGFNIRVREGYCRWHNGSKSFQKKRRGCPVHARPSAVFAKHSIFVDPPGTRSPVSALHNIVIILAGHVIRLRSVYHRYYCNTRHAMRCFSVLFRSSSVRFRSGKHRINWKKEKPPVSVRCATGFFYESTLLGRRVSAEFAQPNARGVRSGRAVGKPVVVCALLRTRFMYLLLWLLLFLVLSTEDMNACVRRRH